MVVSAKFLVVCLLLIGVSSAAFPGAGIAKSKLGSLSKLAKVGLNDATGSLGESVHSATGSLGKTVQSATGSLGHSVHSTTGSLGHSAQSVGAQFGSVFSRADPAAGGGGTTVVVQNNSIDPMETFKQLLPYIIVVLCFFLLIFILFFFRKELAPCISFCEEGCFRLFQLCILPFIAIMWIARKVFYPIKQVSVRGYRGCTRCLYPATQTV